MGTYFVYRPGQPGPDGPQGEPGPQGPPGQQGPAGQQGPQGYPGQQGQDGAQGPPGDDGEQGPPGSDGAQGQQGIQGIQGPPGADGAQGIQGPPGADGAQGAQGIQGIQGVQGPQGVPGEVTAAQLAAHAALQTGVHGRAVAACPATTGTMTVVMDRDVLTIVPSGACTFNASGGVVGMRTSFVITTSGTTSRTLTWGTNFKKVGTLATGTTSGRVFVVSFVCYATGLWAEMCRTATQT